MNKWELKRLALSKGYSKESLKGLTIAQIENMINESAENVLDKLEVSQNVTDAQSTDDTTIVEEKIPDYLDPEWSNYVMKQFTNDELSDETPNINGLRRVAQLLLGPVISSKIVHFSPALNVDTYGRSSCVYEIVIKWENDPSDLRVFQAAAGSYSGNTESEYAKYPEAISDTRAEARCLRKALRINGPAYEEVCKNPATEDVIVMSQSSDKISSTQTIMIKSRCKEYNLNIDKVIKNVIGENCLLLELTRDKAKQVCEFLNHIQTNRVEIDESLKETV